jgi:poly(3-hydroxybutyrate) depolymerase
MNPARLAVGSTRSFFRNPFNPVAHTSMGRGTAAAAELVERTTRRYRKPEFGIRATSVAGRAVEVRESVVWERPFCRLIRFARSLPAEAAAQSPRRLIVAPLSGHYATLLRGTVEAMLPSHDVYITDWADARTVPLACGPFDLNDYVDYIVEMIRLFKGDIHVMAVCQPSVPVLMAVSHLEASGAPYAPRTMILLGGPIDTRINPTAVNRLAADKGIERFRRSVITTVPWPNAGHGRRVYPGFLQLTGFLSMNIDRHVDAHRTLFFNLVQGDGDSAEKHREFYDEYLAVMDLTAEFYLQTVEKIFIEHALAKGEMLYRDQPINPGAVRRVALMTIEGEKDDITGLGQCAAAHDLCHNLPRGMKTHYLQPKVGHYGIFNGSRFRINIVPAIAAFTRRFDPRGRGALHRVLMTLRGVRQIEVAPDASSTGENAVAISTQSSAFEHSNRAVPRHESNGNGLDLTSPALRAGN